ncbi:hypothetical protein QQY79_12420 [Flavobacterium tructae]|uniref:hypothetical protein n=1 Tax=Flavobacterium tructae TaxID=1114873 RepID=UPI002551D5D4|nr:hypothetical protein [Flavobacterium tructae]MDL2143329.1 hypothetical protein [Flavobacterium tructae]
MKLESFFLLLIIILTGTTYVALFGSAINILSILVLGLLFAQDLQFKIKKDLILTYLIITAFLVVLLIMHYFLVPYTNDPIPYMTFYTRCILMGLFLVYLKSKNLELLGLLNPLLKIIALHAIVAFFLSFFVVNFLFNITTEKVYTNSFLYLFFYNSSFNLFGITFYRNQGIFWEPGILQVYMNILFFISSFIYKERRWQIVSVFLIFTTYSTTGIGLLLIQLLYVIFSKSVSIFQRSIIIIGVGIVTIPLFVLNYQSKMNDSDDAQSDVSSSILRVYDFLEGVDLTLSHPFTGVGLSEKSYQNVKNSRSTILSDYSQSFIDNIYDRRSSNSIMFFLSRFGVLFSFIWFYFLYKQKMVTTNRFLFFVIIIVSNFSEPLFMDPFFVLLVCTGLYESFHFTNTNSLLLPKYVK